MQFVPTPLRHTTQGSLPDLWSILSPDIKIWSVMLTWSPFPPMLVSSSWNHCMLKTQLITVIVLCMSLNSITLRCWYTQTLFIGVSCEPMYSITNICSRATMYKVVQQIARFYVFHVAWNCLCNTICLYRDTATADIYAVTVLSICRQLILSQWIIIGKIIHAYHVSVEVIYTQLQSCSF